MKIQMMHLRNFLVSALSILLLISCRDDRNSLPSDGQPIRFTTAIPGVSVSSRAANNSWDAGDRVGIYMVSHKNNASASAALSSAIEENVQYQASESGTSSPLTAVDGQAFYPGNGSEVNFVAYYPYQGDMHTMHNHIYPVDVTTQTSLSVIDLLYHKDTTTPYHRTSGDVGLNFSHQLSKLNIIVVRENSSVIDFSKEASSVWFEGLPRKAKFDLSTGVLSDLSSVSGTSSRLLPNKNAITSNADSIVYESILIPHKGTNYTRTIHVVINGTTYSYTLPDSFDLTSGTAYSYRFLLTARGLVLGKNMIVDWNGGSTSWTEDYYLNISSENGVSFPKEASSKSLSVETNYGSAPSVARSSSKTSVVNSGVSWLTGTLTGSSGTYSLACSATANDTGSLRTGYLHVTAGNMTVIVEVVQQQYSQPQVVESANCIVLKTNGAPVLIPVKIANEAAAFHEANKGSSTQIYTAPFATSGTISFGAKVLWVDSPSFATTSRRASAATDIIAEVDAVCSTLSDSYLRVTPGTKEGNALISITDSYIDPNTGVIIHEIIWSWHIWVVNATDRAKMWIKNSSENSIGKPAATANGYAFFPLNLGAFNATGASTIWSAATGWSGHPFVGLYYQWGRKDPITNRVNPSWMGDDLKKFSLPYFSGGNTTFSERTGFDTYVGVKSIPFPHVFNWGSGVTNGWLGTIQLPLTANNSWGYANSFYRGKTPFDPCPAGWRVPPSFNSAGLTHNDNAWKGVKGTWSTSNGINGYTLTGYGGFYPAVGFRNSITSFGIEGNAGRYWSASPHPSTEYVYQAYHLYFASNGTGLTEGSNNGGRSAAMSVRCVAE